MTRRSGPRDNPTGHKTGSAGTASADTATPQGPAGHAPIPDKVAARLCDQRLLRQAGQGTVYHCRWLADDSEVAVKVLPRIADDRRRTRMATVWQFWQGADPRYVVPLRHFEFVEDSAVEVTDFLPKGSLCDHIANRRATPAEARAVLEDIAGALDHIHNGLSDRGASLVHRDLKPSNILVRDVVNGIPQLCLTDFGCAVVQEAGADVDFDGWTTWEYAAPEMFRGRPVPASDVWSLAITLAELLHGRHPLHDIRNDQKKIDQRISQPPPPIPDELPGEWKDLLTSLLQREPEQRAGHDYIRKWLHQPNPKFRPPDGSDRIAGGPFEFAGLLLRHPSELAAAMGTHWRLAASLLMGYRWQELLEWASGMSAHLRQELDEVSAHFLDPARAGDRAPVDRSVAEVILRLDPNAKPRFRDRDIDRGVLASLALAAARDRDTAAGEIVQALFESQALMPLSRLPEGEDERLDRVNERWQEWHRKAMEVVHDRLKPPAHLSDSHLLVPMLLGAIVDEQQLKALTDRAATTLTRLTRRVSWFAGLAEDATGEDAPIYHAIMILSCEAALDPAVRVSAEVREHARERYRRVVAGGPPADPPQRRRWWQRQQPGMVTLRPPPRTAPQWLVRVAHVGWYGAGYLALSGTAGFGVARGTTGVEGALTTGLLVAAGLCMAYVFVAPRSRVTECLLGAVGGVMAGLALAVLGGTAAGTLLGPAAGWPVFWVSWVVIIVVGAALGATE